jgi:hypothetical protein
LASSAADVHQHLSHNHPLWWLPDEQSPEILALTEELRTRTVIPGVAFEERWTDVLAEKAVRTHTHPSPRPDLLG